MPEPKYSTQEFAQIIKQKYPQYANVEDNALVSKILEKYPQYSSSVDLGLKKKDEQQLDTSMVTEESMVSESQLDGKKEPTLSYVGSRQVAVSPDVVPTEEAFVGARPAPKPMTAEDRRATLEAARESQANNFMNIARNTLGAVAEGAVGLNTYLNRGVELLLLGNQTNYFSSGSAAIGESIQRDKEKLQAEYIGEETVGKPITQTFIEDPVKGAKLVAFEASRLIPQMYALGAAGRSTFPSTTVAGKALETGTLLSPRTKLATEIMSEAGPIIPLGLSAAGTSYAETVKENPEDDIIDAITNYAVASYKGAGEIASELLFRTSVDDLIRGGFRKNLISDIAKADKPVLQALKGTAKKTGTEAFQEGIEELAVEISNNAIDGLVFGEDMLSSNNIYGMADAFILGAGIGGPVTLLSQGPSSIGVANDVNKRKKIAEEVNDLYDQHQNGNLNAADKSIVRGQIINKLAELKKVENNLSDFYSEFSEEDQQEVLKANQIISMGQLLYEDSNSDVAKEAIADFVAQAYSDKTKVEAKYSPNIKVYEYDSEEEAGVPSPIQEREAPIATELEQGPSAEAPEAGGVLQVPAEEGQKVGDLINTRIVYTDPISETIIEGELIQDGQRLVLEEDSGRQIDIGNVEELSGQAVGEIQVEGQTVTLQKATETLVPQEDGSLVYNLKGNQKIPFKTKMFNRQEGLKAIKRNKAGDVTRVTLQNEQGTETYNLTGREAEDAAYYLLRDFANNMELARLEQLIQQNEEVRAELERATAIAEAPVVAEEAAVPVAEEAVQPRVERGVIQESITKAERVLNKLIPEAGVKIVTHNTKAEFDAAMDRVSMRGAIKDAIEYGRFIPSRNEIHINFENADAEAALHEAFHAVFVNKFGKQSQEQREKTATEFESGIKKVLNSGTAQDIDLAKEMDRFVKDGGYSAEEAPEEFLAQLAGFMGANYIKLSKPTQNKLIQWINNFIGKFFPSLKIKTPNEFVDFMNSFAAAANEQVETSEESRPLTPSPIEISPELFPEKSSKGAFDTEGTYLANEPKVNIKDLFTAFKAENNRNPNVWIWMSDQLKRGQYVNPETGVTLDLEGGIGFAFDPKNREQNVVWSSGLSQKTLQDRIGKSDFIWFMSGSPLTSFNFSKGTTKAIIAEIEAGLEKFKGKSLEGVRIKDASFEEFVKIADKFLSEEKYKNVKKWEGINSALTKYKSGIIDHPSRMKVAENLLHEGAGKKMQIPIQQFLHQTLGVPTKDVFHSLLRDEALIKNNIANGDLTLLVKPTGIIDNAGLHDTYPHAITGDVIGMPEQIYNVLDVVPEDAKKVISKETGLPLEKPSAPAQIKTAVGDVGRIYESEELSTNSVYGTMIKESSSKQFIEGQQQSQIDNEVDNTVAESKEWKEKERNSFERFSDLARLKIQDKFRDIIRMQENIELATDKPVGLDQDFRNAETLMYGKAAKDLQDSEEKVKNISDLIKQSGLSIEEFNDLLYALHAQERNRYIRLISTNIGESLTNLRKANNLKVADVAEAVGIEVEDYKDIESTGKLTDIELKNILDLYGKSEADFFYENALVKDGSGMTDQEAQSILAENGVKNLVNPSVKDLPSKVGKAVSAVHNLIQDTRDVMLRDGLETPETISVFDTVYKNYVPLQGFADEEGLGDYNVEVLEGGRKLEVRGRIKEAKGRTTKADSPLVQAVMQNTNTIIRGRKNEVMQKLYNLAKENPNKDVWEVIDPEVNKEYKKAKKDGKISLVAKTISDYMLDPSMVAVRVNGEYKFIRFTDSRMAETLRGATVASTDFIVKFLGRFNRLLSSFITTYDPEFVLRNFSRDIQTAVLNAYSEQELNDGLIKGEKIVASIIKSVPKSIKAIFAIEGGKDVTTEYDKYYKEFVEDGGKTAWFYSKGSEELSNDIQSLLDGKKDSALKLAGNFVERVNTSVENGVRLSAYIESRKAGISREKAAEFAKNLTVNFNKSGEWGTLANSLYLFFNASVQGTSRLIRTLKPQFKTNDDGTRSLQVTNAQKIVIGIAVLGAIMSMINEALSDDDEDGKSFYSKIPDFEKERNIIIMKPNGKGYFKIPLPYGVNVFYVLGGSMADASQGVQGKGEAITNVLQASIGSFSPINFPNSDDPARWITKLLTPTIGQIPVGLALNEDYFGRTIYNDNFPFDKSPKPASELGREGGDWAKWLNKATGGSEFRSGFIDINPDKTDFIFETLSGGAGRFALRSTKSIGSLISGNWDELEPREIPFARVFYGQPSKYINQYDYYEKQVLVNQLAEEAKAGIISGKEKSSVLKMAAINKAVASNLRKYKKLEDAASNIKDPEKKEARLNQLERLRYAEIARFQKIYEKLNIDDIK
jgi:transcriptional regulator with XRE-family HTH domain